MFDKGCWDNCGSSACNYILSTYDYIPTGSSVLESANFGIILVPILRNWHVGTGLQVCLYLKDVQLPRWASYN